MLVSFINGVGTHEYESILVVGDISGKKFNPLQCHYAKNIDILLYECENKSFGYQKKKKDKSEKRLNSKICGIGYNEENLEDIYSSKEEEIIVQEFSDLEEYIETLNVLDIGRFVESGLVSNSSSLTSEVKYVGVFVTGERIFFQNTIRRLCLNTKQEVLRRRQWISCCRGIFW